MNNIVDNLGDCGAANSVDLSVVMFHFSAGRSFGDGWEIGFGVSANDGETTKGMFTKEGTDYYGLLLVTHQIIMVYTLAYSDKDTCFILGANSCL